MSKSTKDVEKLNIALTREELLCLIQGAIKGNVIYGSAASKAGETTMRLVEQFIKDGLITEELISEEST